MSTAVATRTAAGHYVVTVEGEAIEFNHKREFGFIVIGRSATATHGNWSNWQVLAKTGQDRGQAVKWATWGRRQVGSTDFDVLVVPVTPTA